MNVPAGEEDSHRGVFLDESDIIQTFDDKDLSDAEGEPGSDGEDHRRGFLDETVNDDDLSDAEDEPGADGEAIDEADDSMHIFTGHTGELYTVACSPTDGTLVATGGGDNKGFLWKMGHGDWAFEIQGHKDSVSSLAFSTDGQLLASGSFDGLVQIWDTNSGSLKCALEGSGKDVEWVRWHPKGHLVLAGLDDSTAWMWNADTGSYLNMFSGHTDSVTCGDFTPDGKQICTGSKDATLRIWNPRTGKTVHVIGGHPYHTKGLTCLTITSDSTLALTGSEDGSVHIVNITTGRVVSSLNAHLDSIEGVGLAKSFPLAATGGVDHKLVVWDLQHSSPRCICEHEDVVTCLLWLGESKYLATGCLDGKVRVWDSLSGDCVRTFRGHSEPIQSLAVSANGKLLVSGVDSVGTISASLVTYASILALQPDLIIHASTAGGFKELMKALIGFIDVAGLYFALTQLTHRNTSQNHKFQAVGLDERQREA
ncbi:hypothetical protein RHMOL_Rhmol10G0120200 [Rhododendron molle]|uniref:Uncharacterized protein n=2 Tax=Rhododendron molle TaxID=49168 RepID=A0ACC0M1F0_RHOML|nr:hypothetical protein RHMOL_Rhmol10G0120200 [Rhododendron molle]KAI8534741.1 hypothetical protein RHMOL_Rhmol10G0120200 [Rhododendron molle]